MFSLDAVCKLCNLKAQKHGEWAYTQFGVLMDPYSNTRGGQNMPKVAILASGLAVLASLCVIGMKVGTAQVNSNDPNVALVDTCDPATFNAAIGPGTWCAYPSARHNFCGVHWAAILSAGGEHHRTSSVAVRTWVCLGPCRTDRESLQGNRLRLRLKK